jgi:hypothetical protein
MDEGAALMRYGVAVPKEHICYVSWTIDAYDGLGFLRTDAPEEGRVSIFFPSCRLDELECLLDAFEAEGIKLRRLGIFDEEEI